MTHHHYQQEQDLRTCNNCGYHTTFIHYHPLKESSCSICGAIRKETPTESHNK